MRQNEFRATEGGCGMRIVDIVFEILKELKIIRRHLEEITKCKFTAGNKFNL